LAGRRERAEENMGASTDIVKAVEQRLQEIEEQLASYDELVRERDRVRRALGELRGNSIAARPAGGGRAATGRRVALGHSSGRRAKRGSNVAAIAAHPGSTAAEIAAGTGIDRSVVYSATSRLASAGRLRRAPKGDRQVGYEPAAA
jgi:hypothetical protein